jgi:hypothetical protein
MVALTGQNCKRVRRSHEEVSAQDHVSISISITCSSEIEFSLSFRVAKSMDKLFCTF